MLPVTLTCKHYDATHHKNAKDDKLCLTGMAALKQIDESVYWKHGNLQRVKG